MSSGYEQIPESFIRDLGANRRELVDALKKNDTNLDGLVDHLYPDTGHLVFELLQNAEDKGATSANFELSEMSLSFTHDGRPFSKEDIKRITNYGRSVDYEEKDTIGRFGIGFKSVFGCTETPKIYSDTVAFEIVDRTVPRTIPRPVSSIRLSMQETVIELPFNGKMKTADEARDEIRSGLKRMSAMSILHLTSIKSIRWRADDDSSGQISRIELEDGVVQVDAKGTPGEGKRWFLRFREPYTEGTSMHLDVVFDLQERELGQETLRAAGEAVGDHFRIVPSERGSVSVFFPAEKETSNLRFHLHAPFVPELSRASIKEHPKNTSLLERLAMLVARSLPTLRNLGLLDREFLGVLPNSRDPLPQAYEPFREAIFEAMRKEPLVPMQGGGHGQATLLLQGRRDFKDFLSVDDIRFLMSGWDNVQEAGFPWRSKRADRSVSPRNYQGWAVAAPPGNTEVDRLLKDLTIHKFKVENLAPAISKSSEEINRWLKIHDIAWHRSYYASIAELWDTLLRVHDRLCKLPMVRTSSGEYRRGSQCRFADEGDAAPGGITLADPDTYSGGKGAKEAKTGLERLGVREIDAESRVVGILDKYYGGSGRHPNWDEHRNHVEFFIGMVRDGRIAPERISEYSLLLDSDEDWLRPDQLFAGTEYPDATAAPYFLSLQRLHRPVRYELHRRYRNIAGFNDLAKRIGVAFEIPIVSTSCGQNPQRAHLYSGGGVYFTENGTNRDWHVSHLGFVLQQAKQQTDGERQRLAISIHAALDKLKGDTWPPPEDSPLLRRGYWSYQPIDTGRLVAIYRRNTTAKFCTAPSQLVATLRSHAWVPQKQGKDGMAFVKPREARLERLPDGFTFDPGWAWIRAIEFGEERREVERQIAEERRDQATKASERAAMAKDLGFENLEAAEEGKWFAELPEGERKQLREWYSSRKRPPPHFDPPRNPERRRNRAKQEARTAASRKSERRERSVVVDEPALKDEARTKLRAIYEEHAHVSLCQVVGCVDRSFKLNGAWYFEAVRFLSLEKMVSDDYVALCPRHAAMYLYANEPDGLKQRFTQTCAEGDPNEGMTIPVVLAGEQVDILLAPEHALDLGAALEVDGERDSVND